MTQGIHTILPTDQAKLDSEFARSLAGGNIDEIRILLDRGANPNVRFRTHSQTSLHLIAGLGKTKIADLLLQKGADIDAVDNAGHTALHMAVGLGHTDMVRFLLAKGANSNIRSRAGDTPLEVALKISREGGMRDDIISVLREPDRTKSVGESSANKPQHRGVLQKSPPESYLTMMAHHAKWLAPLVTFVGSLLAIGVASGGIGVGGLVAAILAAAVAGMASQALADSEIVVTKSGIEAVGLPKSAHRDFFAPTKSTPTCHPNDPSVQDALAKFRSGYSPTIPQSSSNGSYPVPFATNRRTHELH